MTKIDTIKNELLPLINNYLEDDDSTKLENYCEVNSNLPAPVEILSLLLPSPN